MNTLTGIRTAVSDGNYDTFRLRFPDLFRDGNRGRNPVSIEDERQIGSTVDLCDIRIVRDENDVSTKFLQLPYEAFAPGGISTDYRYPRIALHAQRGSGICRRAPDRHRHGKCASYPGRALKADAAAHHLRKFLHDGQAQSGAAEFARDRGVALGETVENLCLVFGFDPDTGVLHRNGQKMTTGIFFGQVDMQLHRSRLGEFNCISDQVHHQLANTHDIADKNGWNVSGDTYPEIDTFFIRDGRKQIGHAIYGLVGEKLFVAEL